MQQPSRRKKIEFEFANYQILKTGNFQEGLNEKRKLTAGDSALVFTKDLEISLFWTVWTLDIGRRFRIAKCAGVSVSINFLERKESVATYIIQEQNCPIIGLWFLLLQS